MERFKKSLPLISKKATSNNSTNDLDHTLALARKNHDFSIIAQLPCIIKNGSPQKIKKTNKAIRRHFLKRIDKATSQEKLMALHREILEKIDFIENTHEYELLGQSLYNKWHEIYKR